ncbi:MAG: hypothetical protein PHV18_01725 [Lachnospiraceae bacterium]|nr:hypothetical protein [Lachnospiraceae bacterium]
MDIRILQLRDSLLSQKLFAEDMKQFIELASIGIEAMEDENSRCVLSTFHICKSLLNKMEAGLQSDVSCVEELIGGNSTENVERR